MSVHWSLSFGWVIFVFTSVNKHYISVPFSFGFHLLYQYCQQENKLSEIILHLYNNISFYIHCRTNVRKGNILMTPLFSKRVCVFPWCSLISWHNAVAYTVVCHEWVRNMADVICENLFPIFYSLLNQCYSPLISKVHILHNAKIRPVTSFKKIPCNSLKYRLVKKWHRTVNKWHQRRNKSS